MPSPRTLRLVTSRNREWQALVVRAEAKREALREAAALAWTDGHTLAAIGTEMGISFQRVSQILSTEDNSKRDADPAPAARADSRNRAGHPPR